MNNCLVNPAPQKTGLLIQLKDQSKKGGNRKIRHVV